MKVNFIKSCYYTHHLIGLTGPVLLFASACDIKLTKLKPVSIIHRAQRRIIVLKKSIIQH